MSDLSIGEWIAILSVAVTVIIGIIQILRNNSAKSGQININQSSGAFSSSEQKVNLKVEQNDK